MESRAQRRRRERGEKQTTSGGTRKELREAEEELDAGSMTMVASNATTFAVLVTSWHVLEHQREGSRVMYNRFKELKGRGRDVQTESVVKAYAESKQELEILEDQMRVFLKGVAEDDEAEAEELVVMHHPVPGTGMSYKLPDQAADRVWSPAEADGPDDDDLSVVSADIDALAAMRKTVRPTDDPDAADPPTEPGDDKA